MRIPAYNRPYPMTVLGPVPYPLCPVPEYDVGKVHKLESLELYDYLTLFQYPWLYLREAVGDTLILFLSICPTTTLAATGRNASSFSESESSASVRCSSEEVEDGGFFLIGILTSGTTRSSVLKDNYLARTNGFRYRVTNKE